MTKATILISTELLREALEFPETVKILGTPGRGGNIELEIESHLLPEGHPEVMAVWQKTNDETIFLRFEPANHPRYPEGYEE